MITEEPFGPIRYSGTVTSFSSNTAWGFVACPELALVYNKDIFFHVKDCGGATISKGQSVSFVLCEASAPGKPQARAVRGSQHTPDPPGAARYAGTVASFSAASAWGFIACPEAAASHAKDIFFHVKDCGGAPVSKGCEVSFLLDERADPGRPQARSVRVERGGPDGGPGPGRYRGVVANYSSATAWGFIQCPELASVYGKDVFFHNKDCGGVPVAKGANVTFVLDDTTDPTKPQARGIFVETTGLALPGPRQGSAPLVLGGGGGGKPRGGGVGGGARLEGWVQSFSEKAGWGFVECPALGMGGGKGIFFHVKDCAAGGTPAEGAQLSFTLGFGPSGKQQAVQWVCHSGGGGQAQGGWPQTGVKRGAAGAVVLPAMKKPRVFG